MLNLESSATMLRGQRSVGESPPMSLVGRLCGVFAVFSACLGLLLDTGHNMWYSGSMFTSKPEKITDLAQVFLQPANSTHRQYEALRAYFVEKLPAKEAARRFAYTEGSFRVLAHKLRRDPHRQFFLPPAKGARQSPKKDHVREQVVALRKQNLSIYDISRALDKDGHKISPVSVSAILKEEGFARLPRRRDEERPPHARPTKAPIADVRQLDLSPR